MPKSSVTSKTASTSRPEPISWPQIARKAQIDATVIEPEQIMVFENFLTQSECASLVQFVDSLDLELTPPPKRGEATRVNQRASIQSEPFATTLFDLLSPHLPPDFPSFQKHLVPAPKPVLCNPNIRLYKYTQGQFFGPHYDDSVPGPSIPVKQEQEQAQMAVVVPGDTSAGTSAAVKGKTVTSRSQGTRGKPKSAPQPRAIPTWSEWTILIYLTGQEDGITGGETVFYMDEGIGKNRTRREIVPPLTRGTALLHRHGKECLLHEGRLVERGTKYVLRSDLLFGQIA